MRGSFGAAGGGTRVAMGFDLWSSFGPVIGPLLGVDDDPALWSAVVNRVYSDAQVLCFSARAPHTRGGRHTVGPVFPLGSGPIRPVGRLTADSPGPRGTTGRGGADWGYRSSTGSGNGPGAPTHRAGRPTRNHRRGGWCSGWRFRPAHVGTCGPRSTPSGNPVRRWAGRRTRRSFTGSVSAPSGDWSCTAYRACPWRVEELYERSTAERDADVPRD